MEALAELLGESRGIVALRDQVRQLLRAWSAARRPPPVLLEGETGTGKGLLARALHRASPRAAGPFIDLNCAAVPDTLLEAELFGYERGAFTDARQSKPGMFQLAHRGTLFLDEIGLLPAPLQAKLLSVLEDRTVRRLGATRAEPVDVWIVSATNEDLPEAIHSGAFREDLFHRLAVLTLRLPPLRERGDDLLLLAEHFLARACADYGVPQRTLAAAAATALAAYPWPGNVRELANVMERTALLADSETITTSHLALPAREGARDTPPGEPAAEPGAPQSSRELMRDHLLATLTQTSWNISRTATILGVSRNTVHARISRYGLRQPRTASPARAPESPPPPVAEAAPARPLTVLPASWHERRLCQLLVRVTDPLDHSAVRQALSRIAERVQSFGGRIDGVSPTGLLVVFGLEPAEEPAVLGAHAAMVLRSALRRGELEPAVGVTLALHTSEILVQESPALVLDAEGSRRAWNQLYELVEQGNAGDTVVTDAAAALLRRRFALTRLESMRGCRLDGLWHAGRARARDGAPLAGRREELALLEGRLALAGRGVGQVVDVIGEAGIGKSRLLLELTRRETVAPVTYIEGRCSSATAGTPFAPILSILRDICGISETDGPELVREGVAAALRGAGSADAESATLLVQLLSNDVRGVDDRDPARLRKRFFAAIRELLVGRGLASPPLMLAVEDLHWIDPSSQECLASLVDAMGSAPILLIASYRPGYHAPWAGRMNVTQLTLPPLSREESRGVVETLLEAGAESRDVVDRIVARAEGNPLFLEELSRAARERDREAVVVVPTTIEEVLAMRVGRLRPRPRQVLGIAAVIGREVPLSLLRVVSRLADEALEEALDHLQRLDFLNPARVGADTGHVFKHVLVQEVAYARLDATERRDLHLRALEGIERVYNDAIGEHVEVLAHHAVAAQAWARAVPYLYRASRKARARSSPAEEAVHLQKARDVLSMLPPGPDRDRQELEIQVALGQTLVATMGYASAEVQAAYDRAHELCQLVGDTRHLSSIVMGQWVVNLLRANYPAAWALAERLLALVQDHGEGDRLLEAHVTLGMTAIYVGEFVTARRHLELALALEVPDSQRRILYSDLGVARLLYLAWALWFLGLPDEALQRGHEGLARARAQEAAAPFSVAQALGMMASIRQVRGEPATARQVAEETAAYASERGFPYWAAQGRITLGWAMAAQGDRTAGITLVRDSLERYRATGSSLGFTRYLALLADMYGKEGQPGEGLTALAEAARLMEQAGERYLEAEILRLRGELLLLESGDAVLDAQRCFEEALATARRQHAKSLELRVAISLARLWRAHGEPSKGRAVLAPVYAWFTEGLDTADLREAQHLLEELTAES